MLTRGRVGWGGAVAENTMAKPMVGSCCVGWLAGDNSRHFLDLVQIRRILRNLEILSLGASPKNFLQRFDHQYYIR